MRKFIMMLAVSLAALTAMDQSAQAWYHHGGGSHVFVGIGGGYYPEYYAPYPAYYSYPAYPVYAQPPVVQQVSAPAPAQPYCREYHGNAVIGGVTRPTYGTACLQPDGSWQLVN